MSDVIEPRVLERPEHSVSRKLISSNALKVLYRLHKAGHKAYLVGGSVRDLMLDRQPKDFDIATDATPTELRKLFRNARIIGRRFRLAHVIFHGEIVEVSTFRSAPDPNEQKSGPEELLITSDNTFGTPQEDAFRRDFTVNALFYNIADFSVIDYVGGVDDLRTGLVRVIGEPRVRFHEDPVRMLRACEFAGRLGFTIESETQEAIQACRGELAKASPARLTEELLQLLRSAHAGATVQWMVELGLLEVLLPELMAILTARRRGAGDFGGLLATLDQLNAKGRQPLDDVVLLGAVLLPQIMLYRFEQETKNGRWMSPSQFRNMAHDTLTGFCERFSIANFKRSRLLQGLEGFHRLCGQNWNRQQRVRFAAKSYFDDALALFEILVQTTGEGRETLSQWKVVARQRHRRPEPQVPHKRRRPRRRQ